MNQVCRIYTNDKKKHSHSTPWFHNANIENNFRQMKAENIIWKQRIKCAIEWDNRTDRPKD